MMEERESNSNNIQVNNEGKILLNGHTFFLLYPHSGKSMDELEDYSAIIIMATHTAYSRFTIQRLRGNPNPKMYLKPMYFLKPSDNCGAYIHSIVDGIIFNLNQLPSVLPEMEDLLLRTEKISQISPVSFDSKLIMKMLSFAYTRSRKIIEPIPFVFSSIQYSYPGLSSSFEYGEESKVFGILELAEKEGLLQSEYYDTTHYCNSCKHGSLNYRSVCPKCGSSHSDSQDIVHHFPCGYVGPMPDFQNELDDALNCPKCNKVLRHIGVDYDKPSVLHFCKKCDNRFQDFEVKAKCLNCDFENGLEALVEKEIKSYTITSSGENAALNGFAASRKELEEIIGTVKYEFLELTIKYEVERLRQTDRNSNLGLIYLQNGGALFSKISKDRIRQLLKEIVMSIRMSVRPSDIISFKDSSSIYFSMNDLSTHLATILLNEIGENLQKLITDHFGDSDIKIQTFVEPMTREMNYKKQLAQLANRIE
jgi:hypothetical protein